MRGLMAASAEALWSVTLALTRKGASFRNWRTEVAVLPVLHVWAGTKDRNPAPKLLPSGMEATDVS